MKTKKLLTLLLTLAIVALTAVTVGALSVDIASGDITVTEAGGVKYANDTAYSGELNVTDSDTKLANMLIIESGEHNVTINSITVCNILVSEGAKLNLTIKGDGKIYNSSTLYWLAGISVPEGAELVITEASTGSMYIEGGRSSAGIGGDKDKSNGKITISGGTLTIEGDVDAAGIGGGQRGEGKDITITGGTLTVKGGNSAAGIGGGFACGGSNITITGGTVTATGGMYGAGIGGGSNCDGTNITITGGTVIAERGNYAAGIGGGHNGSGTDITISGGTVTAIGYNLPEHYTRGIGAGDTDYNWSADDNITKNIFVAPQEFCAIIAKLNEESTEIIDTYTEKTDISSMVHERFMIHLYTVTCGGNHVDEDKDHKCDICKETTPCDFNENNGFCLVCGAYEEPELKDNYYQIKNGGNLYWFANHINNVDRTANAVLLNDIDLEGKSDGTGRKWIPIGSTGENSNNFRGIFDGRNHTIANLYIDEQRAGMGLFGEVRLGTVENFTIYGDVKLTSDCSYVGGVIGSVPGANGTDVPDHNGATIRNITSYVNVTLEENAHGSSFIGGFIGYANHESIIENCSWYGTLDLGIYRADSGVGGLVGRLYDKSNVTIRNCVAYGTIKTSYKSGTHNNYDTIYIGGVLSYSPSGTKAVLENNLWAGSFIDDTDLGNKAHLSAFGTLNGEEVVTNCYTIDSAPYLTTENVNANGITTVTPQQMASGEVAYKLGEAFGQKIGTDAYPILDGDVVYYGYEDCNSTQKVYSNEEVSETLPDHKDEDKNHTCDVCKEIVTECADEDKNHLCDVCSVELSKCSDEDNNHICDVCTEKLSECSDEDKNCVCDVCGTSIAHKDEDADCVCDVCKTEIHIDENSDSICDKCNIASGSCGENVTWTFNETTGTITLSGTGATKDYLAKSPWFDYIGKFTNLTIENGITGLGRSLLTLCTNLETIHYLGTEEEWGAINIGAGNSSYVNAADKHFCIHKEAQQATCLAGGNESGWYCETCQKYIKGGKEIPANPDNHLDEDSDHFCDACDELMSWCTDGNSDHLCDICKAALHVDDDCDCVCDICKEATHEDEDGDCFCNFCSAAVHIDEDGNCYCDFCSAAMHIDEDDDWICDACFDIAANGFEIKYIPETSEVYILAPYDISEAVVVITDYEESILANIYFTGVDICMESSTGYVYVDNEFHLLGTGDKIMLWKDAESFAPLCQAYIVE